MDRRFHFQPVKELIDLGLKIGDPTGLKHLAPPDPSPSDVRIDDNGQSRHNSSVHLLIKTFPAGSLSNSPTRCLTSQCHLSKSR
jgi:hypothetical protein